MSQFIFAIDDRSVPGGKKQVGMVVDRATVLKLANDLVNHARDLRADGVVVYVDPLGKLVGTDVIVRKHVVGVTQQ